MWKLLRKNLSVPQFLGYSFAGFIGLSIILFSLIFYFDIKPIFSSNDSFMKSDFMIINKKVSTLSNFSLTSNSFSEKEIEKISEQPFAGKIGKFTSSKFGVDASIYSQTFGGYRTQMFFESVPDDFIDVQSKDWKWKEGQNYIPIIIPKTYVSLYNFGFAQSQGLPQLSEDIIGSVKLKVTIYGNHKSQDFEAKISGFSDKLNTILVPQRFMDWANLNFGKTNSEKSSRILIETKNPGDPHIAEFLSANNYETADEKGAAGKAAYFARIIIFAVLAIGFIITLLAIALMLLSISLLIYKTKEKLENLMLLGYSRRQVAKPYKRISFYITIATFLLAFTFATILRTLYLKKIAIIMGEQNSGANIFINFAIGLSIVVIISIVNSIWITKKVNEITAK